MFTIETIKTKQVPRDKVKELIKEQGNYKLYGSGAYAHVYASKDTDIVYKMCELDDNDAYMAYIKLLSKQKTHNPYTPVIYGVRIYTNREEDSYAVIAMEKLKHIPHKLGRKVADSASVLIETIEDTQGNELLGFSYNKNLTDLALSLRNILEKSYGIDLDFHSENFMLRDKQVVFTDPLC